MNRKKIFWGTLLCAVIIVGTGLYTLPRLTQAAGPGPVEPSSLQALVNATGFTNVQLIDQPPGSTRNSTLSQMQANILGVSNTLTDAQKKNPSVNLTLAQNCRFAASCLVTEARGLAPDTSSFDVYFADIKLAPDTKGNVVWLLDAWEPVGSTPGHGFSMFTYGNVVQPSLLPQGDPFVIVNAEPFWFLGWHWWAWPTTVYPGGYPLGWDYWWYDSHNHPNWFWGVYWWWRTDVRYYYGAGTYIGWWWYWWHFIYWQNWYWWSTYFPYCTPGIVCQ